MEKDMLLESVYRRILAEGSAPDVSGLAAYVYDGGDGPAAVVYRIDDAWAEIQTIKAGRGQGRPSPSAVGHVELEALTKGYSGAYKVGITVGPGIGKVIYGLAFALSPTGKIVSDRWMVSPEARAGYEKALRSGRPATPIDDEEHNPSHFHSAAHTPDPSDDGKLYRGYDGDPVLDMVYGSEGWEKPMLGRLTHEHDNLVQQLTSSQRQDFYDALTAGAEKLFSRHYKARSWRPEVQEEKDDPVPWAGDK